MAIFGDNWRNDLSYSSASTTTHSDFPCTKFEPIDMEIPPRNAVTSTPPMMSKCVTMLDVVVFPCVPATAMHFISLEISPNTSARFMIGTFFSLKCVNSARFLMAGVYITRFTSSGMLETSSV